MTRLDEPYSGSDFYCDLAFPFVRELRVEHDDEWILAFHHTRPHWQRHVVVTTRKHIGSLTTVTAEDEPWVRRLFEVVQTLARRMEERDGEAAVVTNLGRYQDSKHLHVHIHSGPKAVGQFG